MSPLSPSKCPACHRLEQVLEGHQIPLRLQEACCERFVPDLWREVELQAECLGRTLRPFCGHQEETPTGLQRIQALVNLYLLGASISSLPNPIHGHATGCWGKPSNLTHIRELRRQLTGQRARLIEPSALPHEQNRVDRAARRSLNEKEKKIVNQMQDRHLNIDLKRAGWYAGAIGCLVGSVLSIPLMALHPGLGVLGVSGAGMGLAGCVHGADLANKSPMPGIAKEHFPEEMEDMEMDIGGRLQTLGFYHRVMIVDLLDRDLALNLNPSDKAWAAFRTNFSSFIYLMENLNQPKQVRTILRTARQRLVWGEGVQKALSTPKS